MKRILPALLALVAALVMGCSGGAPKAVAPETKYDFGDVVMTPDHTDAKIHEFVVKNEGQGDLKLEDVQVKLLQGC
ncbi:MAG TPA: hypothetical protein VK464_01585 [Symbiobacteriaceae bacterium]|nr:hypothetical protein [Symbiobacteriaceae bacterium]